MARKVIAFALAFAIGAGLGRVYVALSDMYDAVDALEENL